MLQRKHDILENAVRAVSEQAGKADQLVDEAIAAGIDGSHRVTVSAKMLRLELLKVKADLERNLLDSSCSTVPTAAGPSTGSQGSA